MPVEDKHRVRSVEIEYAEKETFGEKRNDRVYLTVITKGEASLLINGEGVNGAAPCVLLYSDRDKVKKAGDGNLQGETFAFLPEFLNTSLSFERIEKNDFEKLQDMHDRNLIQMFFKRDEYYKGVVEVTPQMFLNIMEWLQVIKHEIVHQTDGRWTCRIRRYLLQILYICEDIYLDREHWKKRKINRAPADIVQEYIHTNYHQEINLEKMCTLVNLNRTTLNKAFKEKTGRTIIDYLLHYRIKMACEMLNHTNLTVGEISQAAGFNHDTYFIKQFIRLMDMTPSYYRSVLWITKDPEKYKR